MVAEWGELVDVVAAAQRRDLGRVRRPAAGEQVGEFLEVDLVPGGGDEEEHPGRLGSRVEEGVWASGGYVHEASRPRAVHRGAGRRFPGTPVAVDPGGRARLEGEQVEFRATGFHARVIQHEHDHLIGKVFLDRMGSFESLTFLPEFSRYWQDNSNEAEEG